MLKCVGEAQMPKQSIPNVDFRRIPTELAGLWVVLRLGDDQEIVGQGESPEEAMRQSLREMIFWLRSRLAPSGNCAKTIR